MTVGIKQEIMPFVRFYMKDYGRNELASKEAGVHVPNRATFIEVTGHGSKDNAEFVADEWLPRKRDEASRGNYNLAWVEHFEKCYEGFKKGHEVLRQGSPILTWATISPEQNARLRALGYQVIEDVAALPDSSLSSLGLDGRVIRDMARAWLAEGADKGKNTQLIGELTAQNMDLRSIVEQMQQQLAELKSQIPQKRRNQEQAAA